MPKQSIFLKIHLSFWLATVLIVATQISLDRLMDPRPPMDHPPHQHLDASLVLYGEAVMGRHLDGNPEAAVQRITNQFQNATGIKAHLLDPLYQDIGSHALSPEARNLAERASQSQKPETSSSINPLMMAIPMKGPDDKGYIVVGEFPREPRGPRPGGALHLAEGLCVIMIISGAVCYMLARYLTSPVIALREATRRVASGELSVRIAHTIGNRKDELSELAGDFDHMTERIELLMTSQRQLLGDISHELRSPLARLNVALELARRYTGPEAENALTRIEHEARSLNKLIGHVLTLTRLESGSDRIQMESVNLSPLVREITADGDFEARGNNRCVKLSAIDACIVQGNDALLRQAIENIVRNAIQYTVESTSVEFYLKKIEINAAPYAEITVRDHGPGVPDADIRNIFLPFFRVSTARERKTGGTGLGLAIAERAVRLHHGTLKAANAPDGGFVVTMHLPL
ncbi:MAG: HAMP domain-containing protein [Deltaproteobacteria bacterium]|nr:HAMP domain-containing protein [Deltaproteobacteria bacterium]